LNEEQSVASISVELCWWSALCVVGLSPLSALLLFSPRHWYCITFRKMISRRLSSCCWNVFHVYCGFGDEEDAKPGLFADLSEWEKAVMEEAIEHKKHSSKIMQLENEISENVRQRQERRHRLTVFAKQINVAAECPRTIPKTEEELQFLEQVLREDPQFIFCDFTDKERRFMVDVMHKDSSFQKGDLIFSVGDVGDSFYIIDQGEVDIISGHSSGDIIVKTYKRGDSFGELALLYDVPRTRTARCRSDCTVWRVNQQCFRSKLAHHAIDQEAEIMRILRHVPLFEKLDDESLRKFSTALEPVRFEKDERIVNKGDVGTVFYIIEQGQVMIHDFGMGDSNHVDQTLSAGDYFGDQSILTGEPRSYNATALSDVDAFAVDKDTFETSFGPLQAGLRHQLKRQTLKSLPPFAESDITTQELDQLSERMLELSMKKGQQLDEIGTPYRQEITIVLKGKIVVYEGNPNENVGKSIYTLKIGDYYGDKHIRDDPVKPSCYNVVCEENTTVYKITKQDLAEVIGDLSRLGRSISYGHKRRVSIYTSGIFLKDLDKQRVLGHGGYGKVWLVKHKTTGMPYALKAIDKRRVLDQNHEKSVMREKEILASLNHPFILGFVASFQDEATLYLLMNLVQGGELYTLIVNTEGKGMESRTAQFYAACIHLALSYFHARMICYRDLKPENVMIDRDGFCVLVDLGFAKVVTGKTFTLCGTPEYLVSVSCSMRLLLAETIFLIPFLRYRLLKSSCPKVITKLRTTGASGYWYMNW
jgi:CRP-like cAMP-binding protein/tRNA A-37 threonylcarbamoyl transferase component Bud32